MAIGALIFLLIRSADNNKRNSINLGLDRIPAGPYLSLFFHECPNPSNAVFKGKITYPLGDSINMSIHDR